VRRREAELRFDEEKQAEIEQVKKPDGAG